MEYTRTEILFFSLDGSFEEVAKRFYASLGISDFDERDSANCLSGIYYASYIFGISIRLEQNCYDYEDQFVYCVFITENVLACLTVPDAVIAQIAQCVIQMIAANLGVTVGVERGDGFTLTQVAPTPP